MPAADPDRPVASRGGARRGQARAVRAPAGSPAASASGPRNAALDAPRADRGSGRPRAGRPVRLTGLVRRHRPLAAPRPGGTSSTGWNGPDGWSGPRPGGPGPRAGGPGATSERRASAGPGSRTDHRLRVPTRPAQRSARRAASARHRDRVSTRQQPRPAGPRPAGRRRGARRGTATRRGGVRRTQAGHPTACRAPAADGTREDRPACHEPADPDRRGRRRDAHVARRLRRSPGRRARRRSAEWATIDDVNGRAQERGEPPFVLVLDSLEDPQNVGTLLRSAEAVGVHGVLFPTHRQAPLSPAAVKASAGAVEHLLLVPVDDLPGGPRRAPRQRAARRRRRW